MLTQETKRHIDAARQVLVGVVPNPASQIDQITNSLIYKFMDDMDQAAIKAGGDPSFFTGDIERYSWTKLMDTKMGNQERMNLYSEALVKFSEAKQLPQLFRDIFRQAFLPYRSPEVLGLFLKEIAYFDYSHSEELGNAYEYLLSIMSSQGDAGQFRTPRHIIDFIVSVVNPTKSDKVLDPACGTAGFLISAYKHILEQHDGKNEDGSQNAEKPLTPDERRSLVNNFEGYDIDPGMVRIAQVNMYLHQFRNPKIVQYDSLSMDERWNDKFDVILANPPFMSPKGGVSTHNKFSIQSNRSEVLFVDYIMNHLRPNGRAGIIVPEGIIFQSGTAYKQLRKNLVEDGLYAVVSLPSGVFQPYSGVKTSILLFNRDLAKRNEELLFVKVEHDGFDLGAQRRPSQKNDFPEAVRIIEAWKKGEKLESMLATFVEKAKIAESGDYNLSGDRYKVTNSLENVKWSMVSLGDVAEYVNGFAFKPTDWQEHGKPIIRIQNLTGSSSLINRTEREDIPEKYLVKFDDLLISWSATIGFYIWQGENAYLNQHIFKVNPSDRILKSYLFLLGNRICEEIRLKTHGNTMTHITKETFNEIKIPLPPLEVQKEIVEEIEGYQKIIDGARQVVENWKPKIEIDPEWEKVKLGELCEVFGGGTPSRSEDKYWGGSIPWLSAKYFSIEHRINGSEMITEEGLKNSSSKVAPKGSTILITRVSVGKFAIADQDYAINQDLTALVSKSKKLDPLFLWSISEIVAGRIKDNAVGIGVTGVTRDFVVNQEIPLPSPETQKRIVKEIEEERVLVESNKKLVKIYKEKADNVVNSLWSH